MSHTENAIVATSKLIAIGDAIRGKTGESAEMTLDEMVTEIGSISSSSSSAVLEALSVTSNGTYTPDTGVDGFNSVVVDVETGTTPTGTISITVNGTYDVTDYASAEVAISGSSLWNTVTLAEDHTESSIANQKYWGDYLGILSQDDLSSYAYVAMFTNNTLEDTYKVNAALYSGSVCTMIRNDYGNASFVASSGNNYYMRASAGTVINVYKVAR